MRRLVQSDVRSHPFLPAGTQHQTGSSIRTVRFKDRQDRETTVIERRVVHTANMHLAGLETTVIPENWSGRIQIHSALDGTVINAGVERYKQLNSKHLEPIKTGAVDEDIVSLLVETNQSYIRVAEAARTRVYSGSERIEVERKLVEQPGYIAQEFLVDGVQEKPIKIEKTVSFYTSRDFAISEPALDAAAAVRHDGNFDELLQSHILQWDHLWDRCDIQRLDRILEAEGDTTNRYKASKQADVLVFFYLFSSEELPGLFKEMGYDFDPESIPENIKYYLKRSSNGSTLSNIVHPWVLARSGRLGSWELFQKALESDISDIQGGTTHEGIHLGAMAGTVDILQRCYAGLEFRDDILFFNPSIPRGLPKLSMRTKYRGNWFDITATPESMTIASDNCELQATKVGFQGKVYEINAGETLTFDIRREK